MAPARNALPDGFVPTGLLLDLDGTLLDGESRITRRVEDAVRAAARAVPVAIVSGREPDDVARFALQLGLTGPQVADNGARIVDPASGRTVHEVPMSASDSRRVVGGLEARRLRYYAVDNGRVARMWSEFSAWRVTVIAAHAVDEATCTGVIADLASGGSQAVPSTDASGAYWYANFTRAGISKGYGARYFSMVTGADLRGVVAIGDSHNDLPMFAEVGWPVAMGHARQDVRQAARAVVGSLAEDGVAEAIESFVLRPRSGGRKTVRG
jgi:HAD superfamily hydrolase (TIGR01484 family)